jgi:hypothetical protein
MKDCSVFIFRTLVRIFSNTAATTSNVSSNYVHRAYSIEYSVMVVKILQLILGGATLQSRSD